MRTGKLYNGAVIRQTFQKLSSQTPNCWIFRKVWVRLYLLHNGRFATIMIVKENNKENGNELKLWEAWITVANKEEETFPEN